VNISDKAKALLDRFEELTRDLGHLLLNDGTDWTPGKRLTRDYLSAKADLVSYIAELEAKTVPRSGQDFLTR
jgi:hypothetical protein